ncbi:MAG: MOMP family protein [Chlamydiia bacterium]|nr:MOMP family protein [Chlamydiia bacterium]
MKAHFSKLAIGLGAASMFLTGSAFAFRDIDDRLDALEKGMQEIATRNPQGTLGAKFANARPDTNGTRWFMTMDVLYWHPKMGGTEFAIAYTPSDFVSLPPLIPEAAINHRPKGKMKENDFSWDLGLKVGLGYKTPHDQWDVFARYTWFDSHSSNSMHKDYPSTIIPLKVNFSNSLNLFFNSQALDIQFYANHAKSTVDISYNNIDLELARSYFISKNFSVRPHIDIKGALLDISQKISYLQDRNPDFSGLILEFDAVVPEAKVDLSSQMAGLGPRMGLDTKYHLGNGFNIFADVAGSILYSRFKTSQKDRIPNTKFGGLLPDSILDIFNEVFDLILSAPSRSLKHKFHRFIPFAQMSLGLEWNTYFNKNKNHLGLKLGYEVQYYWRANQLENTGNALSNTTITNVNLENVSISIAPRSRQDNTHVSNDLMFYGITGEARLDF